MQEDTALGLKSQQEACRAYVSRFGGELIEEVQEVISASNKDRVNTKNRSLSYEVMLNKRPELKYVIHRAEKLGATIVVKEPSRLTRFSLLMGYLIEYNIRFVCADCPNDNAMMLKLRTVFNEDENLRISQRTKAALSQLKKQGVKLGTSGKFTNEMRYKAVQVNVKAAKDAKENKQAMSIVCSEIKEGKTFQQIADKLNMLEYKTRRGKEFKPTTVLRLSQRCLGAA